MENDIVTAAQAARILSPITSNDATRPILRCVHFEYTGTGWVAVATDSYMLAWLPCSNPHSDEVNQTSVDVPASVVGAITAKDVSLVVSPDGENIVVTSKDGASRLYPAQPSEQTYPSWHSFRDMGLCAAAPDAILLNMSLLDNWRKAAKTYLGLSGRVKDIPTTFSWIGQSDHPIAHLKTRDLTGILMTMREPSRHD